ncbi:hypothetical protein [Agrobacterium cavarae]|uniref:hypothetical protein n=1 Tax=Agrobacterium cavarae TaxID=2528239 RepID=UPI003EE4D28A
MSPAQALKNTEVMLNAIQRHEGGIDPVRVVREVARQDVGMDLRAAENALCVLFETGQVTTDEDMNVVVKF